MTSNIKKIDTQTILSDNNMIKALINMVIEFTASQPTKYTERIHLINALHLSIFNRLSKTEDDELNKRKNNVVTNINLLGSLSVSSKIEYTDGKQQYAQLNTIIHTNMDLLNKYIFGIAHKILNSPYRGKIKW